MSNELVKISLGCGQRQRKDFIGLDIVDFGWNKVWDARRDLLPFGDSSVDFIEAHNFIEHIERKYWPQLFNECWRVLKPNGIFEIIVPDARNASLAWADPTHVSAFVMGTLKYLTGERPRNADYGFMKWIIVVARYYEEIDDRVIFAQIRPNK